MTERKKKRGRKLLRTKTQEPVVRSREELWSGSIQLRVGPDAEPASAWVMREPLHCPACGRVRQDNLRQAVHLEWSNKGVAGLRCQCCGHRWQLPIKRE